MTESKTNYETGTQPTNGINGFKLSTCFRWMGALSVVFGLIFGAAEKERYDNVSLFFLWLILGIFSCLFCLAIAKFLNVADKYLSEK